MKQQTDSKLGKEYIKTVNCYPADLIYMQSISYKMPGWMKHKLESRLLGETSIVSDMQISSVQSLSCALLFATPWTAAHQASLFITHSQSCWNSCPSGPLLSISSSVIPISSCLQSFPASGSFQMSQFFISGGQSIGVSVSVSVLPMNIQDWFPLGWTAWISL